jgi:hypothetical protein
MYPGEAPSAFRIPIHILPVIDLDVNYRDLAGIRSKGLQDFFIDKQFSEFAGSDHTANSPGVVRKFDLVADVELALLRKVLIDEQVVRSLERPTLKVIQAPAHLVEASDINTDQTLDAADRMKYHPLRHRNMWLLFDEPHYALRHGRAAHTHNCRSGRPNDDVGADSASPGLAGLDQPPAQPDDRQDQRHL